MFTIGASPRLAKMRPRQSYSRASELEGADQSMRRESDRPPAPRANHCSRKVGLAFAACLLICKLASIGKNSPRQKLPPYQDQSATNNQLKIQPLQPEGFGAISRPYRAPTRHHRPPPQSHVLVMTWPRSSQHLRRWSAARWRSFGRGALPGRSGRRGVSSNPGTAPLTRSSCLYTNDNMLPLLQDRLSLRARRAVAARWLRSPRAGCLVALRTSPGSASGASASRLRQL
jgi:hypothetical protein